MSRQNLNRRWTTSLLLLMLPAIALPAQDTDLASDRLSSAAAEASLAVLPAFTYEPQTRAGAAPQGGDRAIVADLGLLARDPDQLRIDLPDGRSYVAFRTVSWTEEGDRRYWNGELHRDGLFEAAFDGTLALAVAGDRVSGSVRVEDTSFAISTGADGRLFLGEIAKAGETSAKSSCAVGAVGAAETYEAQPAGLATPALELGETDTKKPGAEPPPLAVIDVLVIFPQSLAGAQLASTRAIIDQGFADSTLIFNNSSVPARFRPVYMGPLYGEQPPRPISGDPRSATALGLSWMQGFINGRGESLNRPPGQEVPPEEVSRLRDHLGADLVLLLVAPDADPNCGVAETVNVATDQFAVIDTGCASGEFLVAHELGHLLGMRHPLDEYETPPAAPYAYAFGYDNLDQLRIGGQPAATVMACNPGSIGVPSGTTCHRIPYFSSPTTVVGTVTIGSATANNAEVARLRAPVVAGRRNATGAPGNLPPSLTIVSPQGWRGQLNQFLTLSAGAFDHEDGDRSANIVWTSNRRGQLGVGAKISSYSPLTGTETFTATVTDSGNLTFSRSVTLVFEAMVATEGAIWHNPRHPGQFLSFNKNIYDQWVATWMTTKNGKQLWYQSQVVPVSTVNGSFDTHLYSYTRPAGVQTAAYFGEITVSVETEKQIRLKVTPQGDFCAGLQTAPPCELLLEPYTRAVGPGSYWSVVPVEVDGTIEMQVDGGWMIWRGPTAFGPAGQEARLLITFDGVDPIWLIGIGSSSSGSPFFSLSLREPTGIAPIASNYNLMGLRDAGALDFTSSGTGSVYLIFNSGNTWTRPYQEMRAATVR